MNQDLQKSSRKRKQNIIAITILVVGTILAFIIFGSKNKDNLIEEPKPILKEVEIINLTQGQQSIAYLEKTIELGSNQSAEVIAEYSGRVTGVNFNVGNYVTEGKILVEFDQSNLINSSKVSFDSAQRTYELAKKGLSDAKDSAEKTVDLAGNEIDLAKLQLKQAKDSDDNDTIDLAEEGLKTARDREDQIEISADAGINSAKIQLEQSKLQLQQARIGFDKTLVKAPISGYVISKKASENDYLNAGQLIAQISSGGKLQATVYLNKAEVSRIVKDDSVKILHQGDEIILANIKGIADIASSDNQRFEVLIELDSENQDLVNQNVRVEIPLELENNGGFFVPLKAVNVGQKRNEVFIVKDGKAMSIEVEMGQIVGEKVGILTGLRDGDSLIVSGNRKVRDGEEVNVAE